MINERFKVIPSVYAFFLKDNKILLGRRCNTGFQDGKYGLPSGHAEEAETLREALRREMREEVGVELENVDIEFVHIMHRSCGDHERVDFFFLVKKWNTEPQNMEPEKCDDLTWFPVDELPDNIVDYVQVALSHCRKQETYSEFGW